MTLIVEDGTGVDNANGYITVAFADSYFAARGVTAWAGDDTAKGIAIIKATDYMEGRYRTRYVGTLAAAATTLSFPRDNVYNERRELVDFATDGIPLDLQKACAEYALRAIVNTDLMPDPEVDASGKEIKYQKSKVGPIEDEVEFVVGSRSAIKPYPAADVLVKTWLVPSGGGVYR